MSKEYLTVAELMDVRNLMVYMNNNYKNSRYDLEVKVSSAGTGEVMGIIKKLKPNSNQEFVFVPGSAYEPYQPSKGGE